MLEQASHLTYRRVCAQGVETSTAEFPAASHLFCIDRPKGLPLPNVHGGSHMRRASECAARRSKLNRLHAVGTEPLGHPVGSTNAKPNAEMHAAAVERASWAEKCQSWSARGSLRPDFRSLSFAEAACTQSISRTGSSQIAHFIPGQLTYNPSFLPPHIPSSLSSDLILVARSPAFSPLS
jgi:hypothetical protein